MGIPTGLFTGFTHPFNAKIKRTIMGKNNLRGRNWRRCTTQNDIRPNTGQLWPRY